MPRQNIIAKQEKLERVEDELYARLDAAIVESNAYNRAGDCEPATVARHKREIRRLDTAIQRVRAARRGLMAARAGVPLATTPATFSVRALALATEAAEIEHALREVQAAIDIAAAPLADASADVSGMDIGNWRRLIEQRESLRVSAELAAMEQRMCCAALRLLAGE